MQAAEDTVWITDEDNSLRSAIHRYGVRRWDCIAAAVPTHSEESCSTRWDELQNRWTQLSRQSWTEDEDGLLRSVVELPNGRLCHHFCRDVHPSSVVRYQLDPSIKRGAWSADEDARLVTLQRKLGNACSRIAADLPGRTDNAIKNRWHSARFRHRKHEETSTRKAQFQVAPALSPLRQSAKSNEILPGTVENASLSVLTTLDFGNPSLASEPVGDSALWADLAACLLDDVPAESHDQRGE